MIKSYPGLITYFGNGQQPLLQELESIARERGLSTSVLTRRMIEACMPVLRKKENKNKITIKGEVSIELVKHPRVGRSGGVSVK